MSVKIHKSRHFLQLLLSTSKVQARALLETSSPDQILMLSEIALNIVENQLPTNTKTKLELKKHHSVLKKLANRKIKPKNKYHLVHKHWKVVWESVLLVKRILSQIVA